MSELLPGDLIAFHGPVHASRGACLVIHSTPYETGYGRHRTCRVVHVINRHTRYVDYVVYLNEEGNFWSRINDRLA